VFVDFCYQRDVMDDIVASADSVTILDHHKSAMENMKGIERDRRVEAVFDMDHSGAGIAWRYLNPDIETPAIVQYIQDRDLWRFDMDHTKEIQAALFSWAYDFDAWASLLYESHDTIQKMFVEAGRAILRKHYKDILEFIRVGKVYLNIGGYTVPAVNLPYFYTSEACDILREGHPFAAGFWHTTKGIQFSLRSGKDGVDVSKIARLFGGGGHRNAAGFTVQSHVLFPVVPEPKQRGDAA
jgi:oligoribonuclease NrnB/cAMP/cGMP phosphodiesterase (DHH superfamily)